MTTTIPMIDDMRTRNLYTQNVIVPQTSLGFKYMASKYVIKSRPYLYIVSIYSPVTYIYFLFIFTKSCTVQCSRPRVFLFSNYQFRGHNRMKCAITNGNRN